MQQTDDLPARSDALFGGAPSPFYATPADRLAWARQRYFEDGERPSGIVSEPVIQSWQRCLAAGLQPQSRPSFDPVTKSRANGALARAHVLLEAAAPEIAQLDSLLAGTGCRVVLTDGQGVVLRATPAAGGGLLDVATRVGVDLDEGLCGSTAPAVSLQSGRACAVSGGEHFFGVLQQIHCVAAPIRNRHGDLAAVLDLSLEGAPFAFDAFTIVRLYAAAIENRLVAVQARDQLVLRFQVAPAMLGTPMQGLAVVDGEGRVGWVNAAGAALLERGAATPRDAETLFGLTVEQLLQRSAARAPAAHRLPSGLGLWLAVDAPGRALAEAPPPTPAARLASLDDVHRRHIERTLADCRGNVSEAARRLGVSRGLLYRRLRQWGADGAVSGS